MCHFLSAFCFLCVGGFSEKCACDCLNTNASYVHGRVEETFPLKYLKKKISHDRFILISAWLTQLRIRRDNKCIEFKLTTSSRENKKSSLFILNN